jgi:methylmalonyl-CoA epimerase
MRAVLDHVGIAVERLEPSIHFFRDAMGLHVEAPEEVASQSVRAHEVQLEGLASLELLEATAPASPIAKFVDKRGPGLHHITLRVDDIHSALTYLAARGVRLVDETPRVGAGGALIAFVHPSAAHGVLVELKQVIGHSARLVVSPPVAVGDMQIRVLHDAPFRLDGGAMFGVVPRTLWEPLAPADDRHRIQLMTRPLLVEASWGRMIVDCGIGGKMSEKAQMIYGLDRTRHLDHALAEVGLAADAIDIVLPTHLHFDHFGGATMATPQGIVPRFPRARYVIRRAEWGDATHPHARNRGSYLQDDFVPLDGAGVVDWFDGDMQIRPGVRVERTGGHTGQHQIVYVEGTGKTVVFVADLIPTTAHIQDPWLMGYDLFPMETLAFKQRFIREAIEREYLIVFEHDPQVAAGYIRERAGRRSVEQVL